MSPYDMAMSRGDMAKCAILSLQICAILGCFQILTWVYDLSDSVGS